MPGNNEIEVQQRIHDTGEEQIVERSARVAFGAQQGGAEVVDCHGRHAWHNDVNILQRQRHYDSWGLEQRQDILHLSFLRFGDRKLTCHIFCTNDLPYSSQI